MQPFSDTVLTTVGRILDKSHRITSLMDGLIERLAPKADAQACSGTIVSYDCYSCIRGVYGLTTYSSGCTVVYPPCGHIC